MKMIIVDDNFYYVSKEAYTKQLQIDYKAFV